MRLAVNRFSISLNCPNALLPLTDCCGAAAGKAAWLASEAGLFKQLGAVIRAGLPCFHAERLPVLRRRRSCVRTATGVRGFCQG
ncbi:MAG: hypothetical protein JZU70_07435 [Chlorobium sp.]|nr:hypothetical protein [Chlorobium sp.]